MDPTDPFTTAYPTPTSRRPLLGVTLLVVEDSRYACEAIRLVCLCSGARIRRADCLRSARRHLRVYRPTVVVIDLGLPDGSGLDLIRDLTGEQRSVEGVLAISGDPAGAKLAETAGADGFLLKPISSVAAFQDSILKLLPEERRPNGPRMLSDELVAPDRIAFQDDMAHVADMLEDQRDEAALDYAAQFISGLARSAGDHPLEKAAQALASRRASGSSSRSEVAVLAGMVQDRLAHRIAI